MLGGGDAPLGSGAGAQTTGVAYGPHVLEANAVVWPPLLTAPALLPLATMPRLS
jgi:hypothetical protein